MMISGHLREMTGTMPKQSDCTWFCRRPAGKHPVRRASSEELREAALLVEPGIELAILPHLYDLDAEHPGRLHLGAVRTDMVILSWLYPRAAYWCLDRSGIKGQEGATLLVPAAEEDDSEDAEKPEGPQGIGALDVPTDRYLYCVDLRNETKVDAFVAEIRRIAAESAARAESKIARADGHGSTRFQNLGRVRAEDGPDHAGATSDAAGPALVSGDRSAAAAPIGAWSASISSPVRRLPTWTDIRTGSWSRSQETPAREGCPACSQFIRNTRSSSPSTRRPRSPARPGRRHREPQDRPRRACSAARRCDEDRGLRAAIGSSSPTAATPSA